MWDLMDNCSLGDFDGVQRMMDNFGAKQVVNIKSGSWTCLHYAAYFRESNIITHLIENGADRDPKDINGETPLRWAIKGSEGE